MEEAFEDGVEDEGGVLHVVRRERDCLYLASSLLWLGIGVLGFERKWHGMALGMDKWV